MSSIPFSNIKVNANTVWRDAIGPGYAVGVAEGLAQVTGAAAIRPYRVAASRRLVGTTLPAREA